MRFTDEVFGLIVAITYKLHHVDEETLMQELLPLHRIELELHQICELFEFETLNRLRSHIPLQKISDPVSRWSLE